MNPTTFSEALRKPVQFLALGLGSGLLPKAPGTWGSALAVPLYFVLFQPLGVVLGLGLLLVTFLLGVYLCGSAARDFGVHDHSAIVWDEFVGQWMVLFYLLNFTGLPIMTACILGFGLFRLFDVAKPWPIRWADQQLHGGFGIMVDDVLAAIMAVGVIVLGQLFGLIA